MEPMSQPILVFDMDGVLVDVSESYRETIARTVEHFTGRGITREEIQDFKNQGGFNDDWRLSHHIIKTAGVEVGFDEMKAHFQSLLLGSDGAGAGGMIQREKWVARPGVLEKLSGQFRLAVFTGRPRAEAAITLRRFAGGVAFDPVVALEDVANPKPAPDGLLRIALDHPGMRLFYVGDSVDDARAARAAGVPFLGIAAPANPCYIDLVFLFQEERAWAIVDDINYLDEVFTA